MPAALLHRPVSTFTCNREFQGFVPSGTSCYSRPKSRGCHRAEKMTRDCLALLC